MRSVLVRESTKQSRGGRLAGLHEVGKRADRVEVRGRARRNVEGCLLDPQPGRAGVPERLLLQTPQPVHDDARRRAHPTRALDCDVDRAVVVVVPSARTTCRTERRVETQARRPGEQHRRPSALDPGEWTRVFDVHAVMDRGPLAPTEVSANVVVAESGVMHLSSRDHPRLEFQQFCNVVHHPSVEDFHRARGRQNRGCGNTAWKHHVAW